MEREIKREEIDLSHTGHTLHGLLLLYTYFCIKISCLLYFDKISYLIYYSKQHIIYFSTNYLERAKERKVIYIKYKLKKTFFIFTHM